MVTLGFLSRLFGRRGEAAGPVGVKMKPGTDVVQTPLYCPECKRQIAKFIPDQGLASCSCGKQYAILNYEIKPLPKGTKLEGGK